MAAKKTINTVKDMKLNKPVTEPDTVNEINEIEEIQEAPQEPPVYSYKAKKAIPMDAQVMVKSAVNGKLVYVSKRLNGYKEVWNGLGEEIPMEMGELYSMKNTDRSFFTENWIEVDPVVLRDLQMERYYQNAVSVREFDDIFEMTPDKVKEKIEKMKDNTRNAFALEAMKRVEEGTLVNFRVISAIEEQLDCELYEH